MDNKQVLEWIEAGHWDVEPSYVPDGVVCIHNDAFTMIKNLHSNSIHANKVVRCRGDLSLTEIYEYVDGFYGNRTFSWWIGPQDRSGLTEYLLKQGWMVNDVYEGLAFPLKNNALLSQDEGYVIKEVANEQNVLDLMDIAEDIWGYSQIDKQAALNERKAYLSIPDRRGHFFIAYTGEGCPVAYGNDRYSEDGTVIYLKGSATLESFRGKGYYKALVAHRLNKAKQNGCLWATVQARRGTSEPILKRLGFQYFGNYFHMVRGN